MLGNVYPYFKVLEAPFFGVDQSSVHWSLILTDIASLEDITKYSLKKILAILSVTHISTICISKLNQQIVELGIV